MTETAEKVMQIKPQGGVNLLINTRNKKDCGLPQNSLISKNETAVLICYKSTVLN